jgi:hypothetical protein
MSVADRRVISGLAVGLGSVGLLLDVTGWYTAAGLLFGVLGVAFAFLMPRGRLRRGALILNCITLVVAAIVLVSFFA